MSDQKQPDIPQNGHSNWLVVYIIVAMVLATLLAYVAPNFATGFELGGEIFLNLLQLVIVPLVMASVMSGILGLGDVRKIGRPGAAAVGYYITTTILAVATGLVVVNLVNPGGNLSPEYIAQAQAEGAEHIHKATESNPEAAQATLGTIMQKMVLMLFSNNLLKSMIDMDLLPLIVFSIIFAAMLTTMGKRSETITNLIVSINDALMGFVLLLMKISPIGIFCLVTARFGKAFATGTFNDQLSAQLGYIVTVLLGLGIHALVTLPLIYWIFTRRNPYRFMYQMSQALLTAFSTASSTATLPITMECAELRAGVSSRSTKFVLPLGTTINMDGTALYEAAAAIFIANVHASLNPEFQFGMTEQITVAITATLAAIGAAGIPEAGLFTMIIVLKAVGLPIELIALILPLDWLLDRFRTMVNAFGDSVGAAIVDQTFPAEE